MRAGQTASQPDQSLLKYKIRSFECDKKSGPGADKPAPRPTPVTRGPRRRSDDNTSTATWQSGERVGDYLEFERLSKIPTSYTLVGCHGSLVEIYQMIMLGVFNLEDLSPCPVLRFLFLCSPLCLNSSVSIDFAYSQIPQLSKTIGNMSLSRTHICSSFT